MRYFNRTKAALASAAVASLLAAGPAFATHSWAGMHWARSTTLTIRLGDNLTTAWDPYLRSASVDWTKSVPIDTLVQLGSRSPYSCSPTYGRVEVCNYRYGTNGWLGIASVWTQYGHIVQGTVRLNDTYFVSASYNTPAWRRFVMCQEIGHTFGLDHQDENHSNVNLGSCMDYTNDPTGTKGTNGTKSNEHPNAHDYDQLNSIYAHRENWQLSSTRASVGATLGEAFGGRGNAQGAAALAEAGPTDFRSLGRIVAVDKKGRGRVFLRSLGGGAELTSFVLWADPQDH